MTETVDITPHWSLGLAYRMIQAVHAEGLTFNDLEEGEECEGLALVALASVLMAAERQGVLRHISSAG